MMQVSDIRKHLRNDFLEIFRQFIFRMAVNAPNSTSVCCKVPRCGSAGEPLQRWNDMLEEGDRLSFRYVLLDERLEWLTDSAQKNGQERS